MNNKIDVHVLYCHEPKNWIDACLKSMDREPVNIHLMRGIKRKVGLARAKAFSCGNAEYVSFVDADDLVRTGCFETLAKILDNRSEVVSVYCDLRVMNEYNIFTGSYIKDAWRPWKQLWSLAEVHHCHLMRRKYVELYLEELEKWDSYEEWVLMGLLS